MPHFFLMDESEMQEADGARLRARLHIRAFWTLMQHKRFAQGVCTLYDGFHHALRWFYMSHAHGLDVTDTSICWTHEIYRIVEQSELVTLDFDFESFEGLLAQALKADFDEINRSLASITRSFANFSRLNFICVSSLGKTYFSSLFMVTILEI